MKINVGTMDRIIRAALGLVIMLAAYFLEGAWGVLGILLTFSAYLAYCPVYHLFGVDTRPHRKNGLDQHV